MNRTVQSRWLAVAAGPILAALAGVGAGGVAGGIVGALVGFGIPEFEAKRYEGRVKHGGILLSVHCDDNHWVKRAEEVLKRTGGEDISSTGEASADYAISDKPMMRTHSSIVTVTETNLETPVVEEPVISKTATGTHVDL